MQLVSLDDLKQLQTQQLAENAIEDSIGQNLSFKDVCRAYAKQKQATEAKLGNTYFQRNWPLPMSVWLKSEYLSTKCPPIKLVGDGSSRTAYACLGGRCLKVAKSLAGVAQNKQELKHTKKKYWWSTAFKCFANTYAANDDFGLILSECCSNIEDEQQFVDAFGLRSIDEFRAIVKAVCDDKKCNLASASSTLKKIASEYSRRGRDFQAVLKYADAADAAAKWLDQLSSLQYSRMSPGQKSFQQLVIFWKKNGTSELMPGDVVNIQNWGFAIRDGKIAPVMLDVGFSKTVADKFYRF